MKPNLKQLFAEEINYLFKLKQTERLWHIPFLAALCVGIPLLTGLYLNQLKPALLASLAGLVILYIPNSSLANRMITLLVCSFGFMVSYTIGICFSFNFIVSSLVFGLFTFAVHWLALYFKAKPPGSFFFIMIASMASCQPFDPALIPQKIGLVGLGTMTACLLALFYSLLMLRNQQSNGTNVTMSFIRNKYADAVEAIILGLFMMASLLIGHVLKLQNPYWVPISCLAVMQGATLHTIWQRGFHRILGTFIGLGLAWLVLSLNRTPLSICLTIMALQFIVEMLVTRHYALTVMFITPMTILLAEANGSMIQNPDQLIYIRFWDISIGSFIGIVGGWFMYHEKIRYNAALQLRKVNAIINKQKK